VKPLKGFVMDDERLKDPSGWDYFDELLGRMPRRHQPSETRYFLLAKIAM